jgi:O-antigen ligase
LITYLLPARPSAPLVSGLELQHTLSINPHQTLLVLIKFLAYFSAFALASHLFDSRKGKSLLVRGLIALGCFEAGYGIVQYLTGWNKIFTYTNPYGGGIATGTYINRNHFAGLLELTLPFIAAMIFYSFQLWFGQRHAGGRRRALAGGSPEGMRAIFYFFLLVMMVVAVVFSHSRAGILVAVFTVVVVAVLAQLKAKQRIWMLGLFLFLICVAGYGLWIGLDPVLARFERMREPGFLQMEGRLGLWKDEIRLIRDYPLTGTGLGTFGTAFGRYQTTQLDSYVDHAHNDYLEFTSETGLVGGLLLFLPILALFLRMIISFFDDPRRYRRSITLGCIGSTLALLVHSLMDFNLQIPANALIFAIVLGIGYKAVCVERREEQPILAHPAPAQRH